MVAKKSRIEVQALVKDFARKLCRAFCEEVLQNLPRELRDMIYKELLDAEFVREFPPTGCLARTPYGYRKAYCMSDKLPNALKLGPACDCCPDGHEFILAPHWLDPDFFSMEFLAELAGICYSNTTVDFGENYGHVAMFIDYEKTITGLRPRDLVTRLCISITARHPFSKKGPGLRQEYFLLSSPKKLLTLNHRIELQITMFSVAEGIYSDIMRPEVIKRFMAPYFSDLARMLQSLKDAGHLVEVQMGSKKKFSLPWTIDDKILRDFTPPR